MAAGTDHRVHMAHVPGGIQHQRHGQVRHGIAVGARGDGHFDAQLPGGVQVHLVVAHAVAGDDLELFGGGEQRPVIGLQARDHRVRLGQVLRQLGGQISAVLGQAHHFAAVFLQQPDGGIVVFGKGTGGCQNQIVCHLLCLPYRSMICTAKPPISSFKNR